MYSAIEREAGAFGSGLALNTTSFETLDPVPSAPKQPVRNITQGANLGAEIQTMELEAGESETSFFTADQKTAIKNSLPYVLGVFVLLYFLD